MGTQLSLKCDKFVKPVSDRVKPTIEFLRFHVSRTLFPSFITGIARGVRHTVHAPNVWTR